MDDDHRDDPNNSRRSPEISSKIKEEPREGPRPVSWADEVLIDQLMQKLPYFEEELELLIEIDLESTTEVELAGTEKRIEAEWKEFISLQQSLLPLMDPDHPYFTDHIFNRANMVKRDILRLIYKYRGKLEKERESKRLESRASTSGQMNYHRRIKLPTFDGRPSEWKTFSDSFQSLVGSQDIPPVQKLIYLKEAVRNSFSASELLSAYTDTNENYERAWKKLVNIYGNPRLTAHWLFNRLLGMPTVSQASEKDITSNVHSAVETYDQLMSMAGIPQERIGELFVVHLLRKSINPEARKAWDVELEDSTDFPKLANFAAFLNAYARSVTASGIDETKRPQQKSSRTPIVYHQTTEVKEEKSAAKVKQCSYCQDKHFIAACKKFSELSSSQKYDFVTTNRLCYNCLGPHIYKRCKCDKKCLKCHMKHHTLLHGACSGLCGPSTTSSKSSSRPVSPLPPATHSRSTTSPTRQTYFGDRYKPYTRDRY